MSDPTGAAGATATVRPAEVSDLRWIASLHARQLPHGFFAELGRRYLRSYHRTFLASPHAASYVAVVAGQPAGFLVGTIDAAAHHRYVIREHGPRLAAAGALALLVSPRLAATFLRTRTGRYARSILRATRRRRPASTPQAEDCATVGVLTHIAVEPATAGAGVGTTLVNTFVERAREAGVARLELVTLAGESGAARFYEKVGWREAGRGADASYKRFVLDLRG